jgi:hypothetical protein
MVALLCFVFAILASPLKSRSRLEAENAALRHQLIILCRQRHVRVRLTNNDRWFFIQLYRWFPSILKVLTVVRCPFRKFHPTVALNTCHGRFPKTCPFRKFHPERGASAMSENRGMLRDDARHPARARNIRLRSVQVAAPASSRESVSAPSA